MRAGWSSGEPDTTCGVIYALSVRALISLIVWSLLEVYAAIFVAGRFGVMTMLVLVAAFSIAGAIVLRDQSRAALSRFNSSISRRQPPNREVANGLLGFAAGLMLLVPGLISGVIGALLLLPPIKALVRWALAAFALRHLKRSGPVVGWTYTAYGTARDRQDRPADYDITGTAEEIPGDAENEPGQQRLPPESPRQ